ncbi:hypothetical protein [uncultured Dialister sp.]|uniref:hypothetical protein n=2 Tax=uncultured Dialister sp. TaxID=278064 RepID=UPI0027DB3CE1|nr:hypothetical protein [uncultured Dialister sp.]
MFHFITEKGINQIGLANTMADGKIKLLQNMSMETQKKTEKPIRGSIQVSSTNESGVCALALPFAWVLLRSCRQREESPASLFLIAFLSSVFLLPSVFPGFQKRKDEKWNSLMSPLSPALFSTADVEKGI